MGKVRYWISSIKKLQYPQMAASFVWISASAVSSVIRLKLKTVGFSKCRRNHLHKLHPKQDTIGSGQIITFAL